MDGESMPTIAWLKVDGGHVARDFHEACERLHTTDEDVVLDLSSVSRLDPEAVRSIERFAARAQEKAIKVALRGVNVEVYKVLKLMNLSPHFTFVN